MVNPFSEEFLKRAREITEGYDKACGSWSQDSQLLHIISEVTEVKDVLRNKNSKYGQTYSKEFMDNLFDELADIFLTSISLVNILGIKDNDLNKAINRKLKIVEERLEVIKINARQKKEGRGDQK
jgi:NTP pyrophosphatase (non-canonical NTP hydrolase)